jgi:hypothetical protein
MTEVRVQAVEVVTGTSKPPKKKGRARITNHRDLLPKVADGRASHARRFRDLVRALIADMGGIENCNEVQLGFVRRLAAATVLSEETEARVVNGEAVDIEVFCNLASTTLRLARCLGVKRPSKEMPAYEEYMARLARVDAEEREDNAA